MAAAAAVTTATLARSAAQQGWAALCSRRARRMSGSGRWCSRCRPSRWEGWHEQRADAGWVQQALQPCRWFPGKSVRWPCARGHLTSRPPTPLVFKRLAWPLLPPVSAGCFAGEPAVAAGAAEGGGAARGLVALLAQGAVRALPPLASPPTGSRLLAAASRFRPGSRVWRCAAARRLAAACRP